MKLPILEDEFKEALEARGAWVFVMSISAAVSVFFGAVTLESGGRPALFTAIASALLMALGSVHHRRCVRIVSAWRDAERAKLTAQPEAPYVGDYRGKTR